MTLKMTAAHSSRITKSSSKNPLRKRSSSSSSPFSSLPRRKPSSEAALHKLKSPIPTDDDDEQRLEDHGLIASLASDLRLRDVAQQIEYIQAHTFDPIPERSGFNSTRIAETLNYQRNLPPIVSLAHVHALSRNPTTTEREIAELVQGGVIRKISIPGRGIGNSTIGDCLVLADRWIKMVENSKSLDENIKRKYIQTLQSNPTATALSALAFSPAEAGALTNAGFLTSATAFSTDSSSLLRPSTSSLGALSMLSTSGSRAATGSLAAVGGESAIYDSGGGGSGAFNSTTVMSGPGFVLSLPSAGPHLRLLSTARLHLMSLLAKSRYKEAPLDILRERWDGGLSNMDRRAARGQKGLEGAVLPAKTKKWKQFYGLRFEWVLEECVGSGLIECFDTRSVGIGVRLID